MASDDRNAIDYEEVLRVLPESFRDSWKDDPDVLIYLSDLGSLGLQRLNQEPERLAEERVTVLEQTQDLAFYNYKTFIQAADCSHTIFKDFNIIESRLDHLLNKLPVFKESCGEFGKEAQMINTRWRQASSTLAKHSQLLEILEIPQLMSNCVRDGLYDEALELSAYVKRLERKHIDIPLIKSIVQDVQAASNAMLEHLLMNLRTHIHLPECLKIVGFLRRMDIFNEIELRIKFLQARDAWFQKVIQEISNNDPYEHVSKIIDSSRVHLFDITTQYRAIFSDDDPLLLMREDSKGNCAIFHSWITWKISWFLSVLKQDISTKLGGKVESLLTQCMYFGLSFSRVNIDFRPLLIPIFENIVIKKFQNALKQAIYNFEDAMRVLTFSAVSNTNLVSLPEESLQPPIGLLDFQPLAQYCNELLGAFNELKLCCSYSMAIDITSATTNSLNQIVRILVSIHAKRNHTMTDLENDYFNKLCLLFCTDLVPHLNKCLSVIFSPDDISQALGITSLEFKKMEYLCKLDTAFITQPLQAILPAKEDAGLVMTVRHSISEDLQHKTPSEIEKNTNTEAEDTLVQHDEPILLHKDPEPVPTIGEEIIDFEAVESHKTLEPENVAQVCSTDLEETHTNKEVNPFPPLVEIDPNMSGKIQQCLMTESGVMDIVTDSPQHDDQLGLNECTSLDTNSNNKYT